ncbi:LCP family protein [Desulfotruncus alcoholivorax]|uniref:LCP family protein n=1 Tax=Desulfotruncus alcoholivorax TaxID=265477 RepID=UPI00040DE203|nr:LCP family protein [Desulfotruncus alcoholivorax]
MTRRREVPLIAGNRKRKLNKPRFAIFVVLLAGLFAGGFALANNVLWPLLTGSPLTDNTNSNEQDLSKLPGINVLMMGVDERSGDTSNRTDTMILANINNKDRRISLLSIPRDTKVDLPGHGVNKINAANQYGGPKMAMSVVSDLTGVPIDYYILTNFGGFKGIVDALGGVTVDVEKDMHYHENAYGGAYSIDLNKGVQRLNGDQALQYARFRHDALGDITRTQRQLKLLTAIGDEVMKPGSIIKMPKLIPEIYKNVDTNLGISQLVSLAKAAKNIDNVQIVSQTLPGWFLNEHGVSYWYVDPGKAKEVASALFEQGKVTDVILGEINQNSNNTRQVAMDQAKTAPVKPLQQPDTTKSASTTGSGAGSGGTGNSSANGSNISNSINSNPNNSGNSSLPGNQGGVVQGTSTPPPGTGQTETQKSTAGGVVETQPEKNHVQIIINSNN